MLDDPVLPLALGVLPTLGDDEDDDESAAIATAEAANSAASVAVESIFNIVASPCEVQERRVCARTDASAVPSVPDCRFLARG